MEIWELNEKYPEAYKKYYQERQLFSQKLTSNTANRAPGATPSKGSKRSIELTLFPLFFEILHFNFEFFEIC